MRQTLRTRGAGELIGQSFGLLMGNLAKLLTIHIGFWIPIALLMLIANQAGAPVLAVVGLLAGVFLAPIPRAASMVALSDEFTGRTTSIGDCYRIAFRRILSLIGIGIMVGLLYMVGFALLVVPGIYFMTKYFVSTQACLLEGKGASAAMTRSGELTEGSRMQVLGVSIVMFILAVAISVPLSLWAETMTQSGSDSAQMFSFGIQMLSNALVGLLFACAEVAIYFNQRVKKDSFDLDALTSIVDDIGRRGAAPG